MKIILTIIYLIFSTGGLILIKLGGNSNSLAIANSNMNLSINLISLLGMLFYIVSFLLFIKIVTMFNLSYIIPICTGIAQIILLIAGYFIFKEEISIYTIIGVALIIFGILMMNLKK